MLKRSSGSLYTWSDSYFTQLGHKTLQPIESPLKVDQCFNPFEITPKKEFMELSQIKTSKDLTLKFSSISTGPYHTLCVSDQGSLLGMGEKKYNKRGNDSPTYLLDRVSGLSGITIKEAACGLDHSLALSNIGEVYSWGYGGISEKFIKSLFFRDPLSPLGHNTIENLDHPKKIEGLENIRQVEAGYHHSLALTRKN
jgi:alpha-tubulin suppressor-like RCC1 family protein